MIAYEADMGGKILVLIMKTLNSGIYSLIATICQIFMDISETQLFADGAGDAFMKRIYVVLGIFMLFKLAFSLLSAVVNPDALLDKEKGMQKIVPRTIIALMMLIMVPTVFNVALEWQGEVALAIPRIILGTSGKSLVASDSNQGELLASTALSTFFSVTENCELADSMEDEKVNKVADVLELASKRCKEQRKVYNYQFNGFVSVFVGVFLIVMLASYCIDIAIRTIKLGLLRILAPIPIITYIDPKSEKNGAFGNWLKECISTYLELFIKLAVLYFVLYILGGIASGENSLFTYPEGATHVGFIKLFLIMGAFFFMGKAADFICNILGVKKPESSGGFLKGLAGLGAAVGIGAGVLSGGATNFRDALTSAKVRNGGKDLTGWNKGAAIASAILSGGAGAIMGAATAGQAVAGTKKGKMGAAISAVGKRNVAHAAAAAGGATLLGKVGSSVQRAITGETSADKLTREIDMISSQKEIVDAILSRSEEKAKTSIDTFGSNSIVVKDPTTGKNRAISVAGNYSAWSAAFSSAKTQGLSGFTFNGTAVTMEQAELLDYGLLTSNSESYIKHGGWSDSGFHDLMLDYKAKTGKEIDRTTTRKALKDESATYSSQKSQKNRELKEAKANAGSTKA